jgi:hypothetical protein
LKSSINLFRAVIAVPKATNEKEDAIWKRARAKKRNWRKNRIVTDKGLTAVLQLHEKLLDTLLQFHISLLGIRIGGQRPEGTSAFR